MKVQVKQCATCIYRPNLDWDIKELERQIADPHMPGFFSGFRVCHDASDRSQVCCRGFWNRHKDHFALGQIAQRLGFVRFVSVTRRGRGSEQRRVGED